MNAIIRYCILVAVFISSLVLSCSALPLRVLSQFLQMPFFFISSGEHFCIFVARTIPRCLREPVKNKHGGQRLRFLSSRDGKLNEKITKCDEEELNARMSSLVHRLAVTECTNRLIGALRQFHRNEWKKRCHCVEFRSYIVTRPPELRLGCRLINIPTPLVTILTYR